MDQPVAPELVFWTCLTSSMAERVAPSVMTTDFLFVREALTWWANWATISSTLGVLRFPSSSGPHITCTRCSRRAFTTSSVTGSCARSTCMLGTIINGVPRERATDSAIIKGPCCNPWRWLAITSLVAGATSTPSAWLSTERSPSQSVMTSACEAQRTAKGVRMRCAEGVMITVRFAPSRRSSRARRTVSTAAIPPVTPRTTWRPLRDVPVTATSVSRIAMFSRSTRPSRLLRLGSGCQTND